MCLPYPLPSHCPACGCQESRSLAVPAPHAYACLCTLSGPLFIQAPRFSRWYVWFRLKLRGEQLHIKERHRVAVTELSLTLLSTRVALEFLDALVTLLVLVIPLAAGFYLWIRSLTQRWRRA